MNGELLWLMNSKAKVVDGDDRPHRPIASSAFRPACATPTGSAGHAGATANLKLTFHLDHSPGADQFATAAKAAVPFPSAGWRTEAPLRGLRQERSGASSGT
jgi:hypothetical protein